MHAYELHTSPAHSCLDNYVRLIINTIILIYWCAAIHRNIVSTVTLGCKLDLKDIALRARNAEYNPKVIFTVLECGSNNCCTYSAFCCCDHENQRSKNNCPRVQLWEDGLYWS